MAVKVFELARELEVQSKELLEKASGLGIELKSHMSTLSEGDIAKLKLRAMIVKQQSQQLVESVCLLEDR